MDKTVDQKQTHHKVEKLFLIFAVIFGLITAFVQPIFSPPDEYTHFRHAYNIFHSQSDQLIKEGDELAKVTPPEQMDKVIPDGSGLTSPNVEFAFQKIYRAGDFVQKYFKDTPSSEGKFAVNLGFADLKWLPQAIGVLIGSFIHPSFGVMTMVGRLLNLLVYVVGIYFAIKKARFGKWVMAAVALLPVSIQQAASLSYDVIYYVAIFAVIALLTHLWTRRKQLDLRWGIYIFLLLVLLFIPKASVLALGLFFVTLPTELFGDNKFSRALEKFWSFCSKYKWLTALGILLVFCAYLFYEFKNVGNLVRGIQALVNTFFRPDLYGDLDNVVLGGVIGNFGQMTYRLPAWVCVIDFIFLFLLLLTQKQEKLENRIVLSSGIIYFSVILMTAVEMLLSWTTIILKLPNALVSLGNQGRYYTPFLIVLIPLGGYLSQYVKINMSELVKSRLFKIVVLFNLLYFLVLTFVYYYTSDMGAGLFLKIFGRLVNFIS